MRARCFFIGYVDNYQYVPNTLRPTDWLDLHCVFRNSEIGTVVNKGIEMLNYADYPVVEDVVLLPGKQALPFLAESLEYDASFPRAAAQAFRACVHKLAPRDAPAGGSKDALADLNRIFVRLICSDSHLPSIYAGHEDADLGYVRQLGGVL